MEIYPNFFIVGAAKAGTTSIYEYIRHHPDIFMSEIKEPTFFPFANEEIPVYSKGRPVRFVTKIEDYLKLFEKAKNEKCKGEASTPYLFLYEKTIKNIKKCVPCSNEIKIIIILRNPTERAFSHYMMKVRDLSESLSFKEAIRDEPKRIEDGVHFDFLYLSRGLYYEQVKAYLNAFPKVKVCLYDDLRKDKVKFLKELFLYLDVDPDTYDFNFTKKSFNQSGKPRLNIIRKIILENFYGKRFVSGIIPKLVKARIIEVIDDYNIKKEFLDEEERQYLYDYYEEDVKNLENLIQKDLSSWR